MKKLYIIDGHSHIYASYYAIKGLRAPSGEPTNAVYGMTAVLLKLLKEHEPELIAAVFDPEGKTFRNDLYPEYKTNRPPTPDDLKLQIEKIKEIIDALGIRILSVEGYEADDLIATLATLAEKKDIEVIICSKDKDLEQLISEKIKLYDTTKDKITDLKGLQEEKNLRPEQIVDMLALAGDPIDNIPGIPSVGPKTATKLIKEFGSIDNIIKNKEKLAPKIRNHLKSPENIKKLYLSRELVMLKRNIPLSIDIEKDLMRNEPKKERLAKIFYELGFNRFIEQLDLTPYLPKAKGQIQLPFDKETEQEKHKKREDKASLKELEFRQVRSIEELKELKEKWQKARTIAVDTETTGIDPLRARLVGIAIADNPKTGYYIPLKTIDGEHLPIDEVISILKPILEDASIKKIGQNIKYDINVLRQYNVNMEGIYFDTMIASYLLDPARSSHSLDYLAQQFLNYKTTKLRELIGRGKNQLTLDLVKTSEVTEYSAEDAVITFNLYLVLSKELEENKLTYLFENIEMPLVNTLADMEYIGVSIDKEYLNRLSEDISKQIADLSSRIFNLVGHPFNIDSPKQLADVLFNELKLPVIKRTQTSLSTDIEVLQALTSKHPIATLLIEYRQLTKLKNTYIDKLPEMINPKTGKIHTSFNQTATATGRLSSSNPNLQNIPIKTEIGRKIRAAFVPEDRENNLILTCDYSQIELRILAHFSEDPALVRAFLEDKDIHAAVAAEIFGTSLEQIRPEQRNIAKTVNFGIIYGQSPHGLAKTLGISRTEAKEFIEKYFRRYPKVKEFTEKCISDAKECGYVKTISGRKRFIPEIHSKSPAIRALGERTAINTVVQGSAADLIKLAMVNIHKEIKKGTLPAKMIIQVHDELVFESPEKEIEQTADRIKYLMDTAMKLNVPLKTSVGWGKSWLESK